MVKLPPHAKVGHRKYRIEELPHGTADHSQKYGDCNHAEGLIRVATSYGMEMTRDTLLHEVLHAVYREYGLQDEDKEERTVATLATGITQTMCDSPELRQWLAKSWAK